jgi:N-dimethylarginine dimethylaminohydrolase
MAILMCRPEYFGVEYEINPWMNVQVQVDHARATEQWDALHQAYSGLGVDIELAQPVRGLPDMVFTANAAVLVGRRAVLSSFHHAERQGEEVHWWSVLEGLGFDVLTLPRSMSFEGAGDALFVGKQLFCGYGFRTDRASHRELSRLLDVEVTTLRLVDPRFYHLDTCFCPLNEHTALFAPEAFDAESQETVRRMIPHVIEVPADVAAGFACNAMPVQDTVLSSLAIVQLEEQLHAAGFQTIALPMGEFMKSGGGVRCLSLPLDAT